MRANAITIRDAKSASTASILPDPGFNCFSFKPVIKGIPIEALWAESGFGPESEPDLSGIPILFPFGSLMTGSEFTFEGAGYKTPGAMIHGVDAMHGYVLSRPWRIVEQSEDRVAGEFQASIDDPTLLAQWPADFKIPVAYEVAGSELRADVTITNPDAKRLPFIFATHPYFALSLGGGKPEDARVTIPASTYWVLTDSGPNGEERPVDEHNDLRAGPALAGRNLNDIYAQLVYNNGGFVCEVLDPVSGRKTTQTTAGDFNCCVVYTHAVREAIAIEPYIGMPDAFKMEAAGISSGMKILEPGGEFKTQILIRVD